MAVERIAQATPQASGQIRALVVDDHAHIRDTIGRLLDRADGIVVVGTAADGDAALELAAAVAPDVIVMDLSMPVLDGVEATRRVRASASPPAIVALTGSTALGRRALDAGAVACVFKDSEPTELIGAVRLAAASA
jgi:DNA-binding NarL/FixJ family response regulator